MNVILNPVVVPFQVGDDVFINQPLYYWSENLTKVAPYFSGVIREIELCINPASRLVRNKTSQITLLVDLIRYEIWPHSPFNPFGSVQIFDRIQPGFKLFPTERALLQAMEHSEQTPA